MPRIQKEFPDALNTLAKGFLAMICRGGFFCDLERRRRPEFKDVKNSN